MVLNRAIAAGAHRSPLRNPATPTVASSSQTSRGGVTNGNFLLTDPVICSEEEEFGATDLGLPAGQFWRTRMLHGSESAVASSLYASTPRL